MSTLTPQGRMAKVWPLVEGLKGCDASGAPVDLRPGVPGYMLLKEAQEREKDGELDLMAGKTYAELREPVAGRRTRVVTAQAPEDLDSVSDSDDAPEHAAGQTSIRRRRRSYKRRDVVAEKPK